MCLTTLASILLFIQCFVPPAYGVESIQLHLELANKFYEKIVSKLVPILDCENPDFYAKNICAIVDVLNEQFNRIHYMKENQGLSSKEETKTEEIRDVKESFKKMVATIVENLKHSLKMVLHLADMNGEKGKGIFNETKELSTIRLGIMNRIVKKFSVHFEAARRYHELTKRLKYREALEKLKANFIAKFDWFKSTVFGAYSRTQAGQAAYEFLLTLHIIGTYMPKLAALKRTQIHNGPHDVSAASIIDIQLLLDLKWAFAAFSAQLMAYSLADSPDNPHFLPIASAWPIEEDVNIL